MNVEPVILVLLTPAVLGLVQLIKQLGVTGRALMLVSMAIGTAFTIAAQLLEAGIVKVILYGVLAGLSASGLYDFSQLLGQAKKP